MKKRIIKLLILIISLIVSFTYTIKALDKINLDVDNLLLESITLDSTHIDNGLGNNIVKYVLDLDVFDPVGIFVQDSRVLLTSQNNNTTHLNNKSGSNNDTPQKLISPNKEPIVYIYNTHQKESYASITNNNPTVLTASYMLQEKLKTYGIESIVEDNDVSEILRINGWNYASSYVVTKLLMEQAKHDYPSLKYYIDLHRDSIPRSKTTITIGNKAYAKVLFLLGLENEKYPVNKGVISKFDAIIKDKYPGISKGIYEKGGYGVNGVYNQDFSSNCLLIEVGGEENTIDEVSNTIDAIADMINTYVGEYDG